MTNLHNTCTYKQFLILPNLSAIVTMVVTVDIVRDEVDSNVDDIYEDTDTYATQTNNDVEENKEVQLLDIEGFIKNDEVLICNTVASQG